MHPWGSSPEETRPGAGTDHSLAQLLHSGTEVGLFRIRHINRVPFKVGCP